MTVRSVFFAAVAGLSCLLVVACGGTGSDHDNLRPLVDAGVDQAVTSGDRVVLDGSGSRDGDGEIVRFVWERVEGPDVTLTDANRQKAGFTAPTVSAETPMVFRLTVTDDDGATASDELRIIVKPVATAATGMDERPANPGCVAPERPTSGGTAEIELRRAFSPLEFEQPVALLQAPGNHSRWYVVERGGYVRTFTGGQTAASVFADLTDKVLAPSPSWSEQGLLGMAFHPDFASNHYLYLSYTRADGASVISRFSSNSDGTKVVPASEQVILTVAQPNENHNGGGIAFGPDGFLYIGLGDGGGAGDADDNAQNTGNLLGAMLRIDVNKSANGKPYAIPADNPFAASAGCSSGDGCPEIWAWGLRNPWRWSFDTQTGKLWAGDVGQDKWEEVDIVEGGKNYGWRCYEGSHPFNTTGCGDSGNYVPPVVEYGHNSSGGFSITGGYVYRGSAIPALNGTYLYGDFGSGTIWGLSVEPGSSPQELLSTSHSISSFAQGNDGELYLMDYSDGKLWQIVAKGGAVTGGSFPQKLSQTGCFKADDPTQPEAGLIPYGVNSLLWSDGAEKYRWFAIPDGTTIQIDSDGNNWIFPKGSVLIKEFRLGGKRVETRLLIRHADGEWAGYSYQWDDRERDATLLTGAASRRVNGQVWDYPSRRQCMFCHTRAAGYVLGPETLQMNGLFTYPDGRTANQMATYDHIGLFTSPLSSDPESLVALVDYRNPAAPLVDRARAYLHANCSSCHRPGETGLADFRYGVSFAQMGVCDADPQRGDMGIVDAPRLLAPGEPSRSVIMARMESRGAGRMPMLGTRIVDQTGVTLIRQWISSLAGCS